MQLYNRSSLLVFLSFLLLSSSLVAQPSGSGTSGSPYLISNMADLTWVSENSASWGSYFEQTANINAAVTSGGSYNGTQGFIPIGNSTTPFTGQYNGAGYSITGLHINRPTTDNIGMFGQTGTAVLYDLTLENCTITGRDNTGALCGKILGAAGALASVSNISITNASVVSSGANATASNSVGGAFGMIDYVTLNSIHTSGTVQGRQRIGGILGWGRAGTQLRNSSSSMAVSNSTTNDTRFIGGVAGVFESNTDLILVERVFATGNVSLSTASTNGNGDVGGFAGLINNLVTINNAYAQGSVTGPSVTTNATRGTGGFAGRIAGAGAVITNAYATGAVVGTQALFGGFSATNTGTVTNSFWDTQTSGRATSAAASGLTTANMKLMANFYSAGWDMQCERLNGNNDYWGINPAEHNGYPFLSWQNYTSECPQWIGTTNTSFTTSSNWRNNDVPLEGMDFYISNLAVNNLLLHQNWTSGDIGFNYGNRNLELNNFNLTILGTIFESVPQNYIQTNGTGKVAKSIAAGANFTFWTGNSAWNPITITNNTGSADVFEVRVIDFVYANGLNGPAVAQPHIMRTWDISKSNPNAGAGVNLQFFWNSGENSGVVSTPALYHFGSSWSLQTGTTTSNASSLTYTGYIGSFSPFAIGDIASPLPVSWLSFTAGKQQGGNGVLLNWSTSTETANRNFFVEHSTNGTEWSKQAVVPAAGNTTSIQNYSFVHTTPLPGVNLYRIRQNDVNEKYTYSNVVPYTNNTSSGSLILTAYPNPVKGSFFVQKKTSMPATALVYNNGGVLVRSISVSGFSFPLELGMLSPGVYQLVLLEGNEKESVRFVKE